MMSNLIATKFLDFKGLERNSNQPDRRSNLLRCKNMITHQKPGTLTIREGYDLRYSKPVDGDFARLENTEYVSFDNFFERTAGQGTEVTVLVEKSEIVAPTISGSKLNNYKFRAANIWIRPYWKGSYWLDEWQWLNEAYITNITVAPDATYKNKIQFEGYFDNLTQWTIVNVTKSSTTPYAVLKTKQNGTNTDCWVSIFDPVWDVDDVVVLFRNYIPITTQIANYDVLRKEISFHRILSKMRIGFGGKEKRLGYAVQYLKKTLQMKDYDFDAVDPEIEETEFIYATGNKVVLTPYIAFNDNDDSYGLIIETAVGDFAAGEYYFRLTAVLDGTDEVMVLQQKYTSEDLKQFYVKPRINLGTFNRRLTAVKCYFSETGDDYYFVQEFPVSLNVDQTSTLISAPTWLLLNDGWLQTEITAASPPDQHVEDNAASAGDSNNLGSWFGWGAGAPTVSVVAATAFAIKAVINFFWNTTLAYPISMLDPLLKAGGSYAVTINRKGSVGLKITLRCIYTKTDGFLNDVALGTNEIGTVYASSGMNFTMPDDFTTNYNPLIYFDIKRLDGSIVVGDEFYLEQFEIREQGTVALDIEFELGSNMNDELGYQPTFNLVRDWMQGVVRSGITWLVGSFFKGDGRYDNKIFGSQISGLTANMYDVIPAQTYLDVDRYKGEVIVGIAVLANNAMIALKDGTPIIIDPETGQIYETPTGDGCIIKNTILVVRNTIFWQSRDDILMMSASDGYLPKPVSERFVRDIIQAIADKSTAHACMDRYGAYRIALVDSKIDSDDNPIEFPELLLTDRGWMNQERYHHPEVYRNGLAGRVWFMNEGDIYAFPFEEEEFIGYADVYGNYNSGW